MYQPYQIRKLLAVTLAFSFIFTCCKNKATSIANKIDSTSIDPAISTLQVEPVAKPKRKDGIPVFTVDDYPVPTRMFVGNYHHRESGLSTSDDAAWFANDTLKQTLVFVLYTDFHRLDTYHFLNDDIPAALINNMELHTATGESATAKQKQKDFKGFLIQVKKIPQTYFVSNKGFKPGDSKEKAITVYGNPDISETSNGIEKDEWKFTGDINYDGKKNLNGKPLAEDSFGHKVTMFFRKNKLIGLIIHNDIP